MEAPPATPAPSRPDAPLPSSPWALLGIGAAPLVMAGLGLTHPADLTLENARHWLTLHLALIPLFPLIGVNVWWLLAGVPGPLAWLARIGAFGYAAYYPAVDLLAGVGTGRLVGLGVDEDSAIIRALSRQGNVLGDVGNLGLLAACGLTLAALWPSVGRRVVPGGVALLAGAWLFTRHHLYPPLGVTGMLLLALGFVALLWARRPGAGRARAG